MGPGGGGQVKCYGALDYLLERGDAIVQLKQPAAERTSSPFTVALSYNELAIKARHIFIGHLANDSPVPFGMLGCLDE